MSLKRDEMIPGGIRSWIPRERRWYTVRGLQGVLCILAVLVIIQGCSAAPPSFARMNLSGTQEYRNMSVSVLETIDLMDPSASRVTLLSTTGDESDRKTLPLPSIRNVRRIFSSQTATWHGNTLTILGGNDTTVSLSSMTEYQVFIRPYLPRVRIQVPGATADVLLVKVNASTQQGDLPSLIRSTERAYLMHDPRGILAIQQHPLVIGAYGSWSHPADYNESDFGFTLTHNAFPVTDWTLDPTYARWVSGLTPNITGNPPTPGNYLLSVFQYDPAAERLVSYAAWPVSIMDGDNWLELNRTRPWHYDLKSGDALLLTFENTTQITNLSYVIIRENSIGGTPDTYDAEVRVNMSAIEELGIGMTLDLILAENPLLAILKAPGISPENLTMVVSYTITSTTNTTPPASSHPAQINITPGYGISGYATQDTSVVVPRTDLQGLLPGTFRVYGLGAGQQNEVTALDAGLLIVGYSPTANFTANVTSGAAPLAVQFTDNSTGTPSLTYAWDFGDGGTSSLQHPVHVYSNPGNYTVNLTVTNDFGSDSTEDVITVTTPVPTTIPTTAPTTVPTTIPTTAPTTVPTTVTTTAPTTPLPPPPVAQFTANATTGEAPLAVQFIDQSTGSRYEWTWDFGDGGTSGNQNPAHVYLNPGNYTVSLTVRGIGGTDTEVKSNYIQVLYPPPVADFTANVTSGEAPLAVQFIDLSGGNPASWSWNFGDNTTSSLRDPVHVYPDPGTYTVTLRVTNPGGSDTRVRTGYITVTVPEPELRADFSGTPLAGYAPLTVTFTDASTGEPVSWSWLFGDGGVSDLPDPVHTYGVPGVYAVSLTVANATANDTLTRDAYVTVYRRGGGGGSGGGGGGGTFVIGTTATPTPTPTPAIPVGPQKEVVVLLPGVEGQSLEGLNVTSLPDEDLPPLPVGPVYMGYAWLISPEDAVIEPFARLSVTFTAEQWLNLIGKDLVMMWYDPVSGTWQPLATTIDDAGMSVSGRVTRGGIVALMSNGRTTTPTMSPTITPSPTMSPEMPSREGLGPWIWIIPVVVIIAGCALAAVYILRVRTGPGKPPS